MNDRVAAPYGDIFSVSTPSLDQLGQRLYAEQKMREQQQLVNSRALEEEFSKNISNIRDADVDDLTGLYNDFKQSYMALEKMGERATPQDQMNVTRKRAAMYKFLNESSNEKKWEDTQVVNYGKDKEGVYSEQFPQLMQLRRSTPLSKIDRTKDADLLEKYYAPDLSKQEQMARGKEVKEVLIPLGKSEKDPLSDDFEVYKVGNSPTQFFTSFLQSISSGGSKERRNTVAFIKNKYNQDELNNLQNQYFAKINDPKYKKLYGETQPFPSIALNTPEGYAAMIKTMEEVVNNPLVPSIRTVKNTTRITEDRQKFQQEQQARSHAASLARLRESIAAGRIQWMNATQTAAYVINADNTVGANNPVQFDPAKYKTITGVEPFSNSDLRSTGDGGYIYGIKQSDGTFVEKGRVDPVTAQDRLTQEAAKTKVPNPAIKPTVPNPKPKTNKNTKKPSWAN